MNGFAPHTAMIVPSLKCEAHCSYCFGPHEGERMPLGMVDECARFLSGIWENQRKRKIIFHGGEPLLAGHAWFEYALKTLSEALNHSALFSIQTNLWALDQEYVDLFARYRVQISTSLDGDRETTDSQRGEGYFNQTMRGVKLLMENGIAVSAIATVTPYTIDRIPETVSFFHSLGIPFSLRGAVASLERGMNEYCISSADNERIYQKMFGLELTLSSKVKCTELQAVVKCALREKSELCTFSNCLGQYVAIAPDGGLYSCQRFVGSQEFRIGIVGDSPKQIKNSPGYQRLAAKYEQTKEHCGDCTHFPYCNGGCLYSMMVAERYGAEHPFCNDVEQLKRFYRSLFDGIQLQLAREMADVLLERKTATPYLALAGEEKSAADTAIAKRRNQEAFVWGKTIAPKHAFSYRGRREHLFLNITGNCPLACSHCAVNAGGRSKDMSLEVSEKCVEKAIEYGYRILSLNGGEPLIYTRLTDLLEYMQNTKHPCTDYWLFTSLYPYLSEELAQKIRNVFSVVCVSLDGDEINHDRRRGTGSFQRTCDNIQKLVAINGRARLMIRATLTQNQREEGVGERVKQIARDLGVFEVQVTNIFPIGRAKTMERPTVLRAGQDRPAFENPCGVKNRCGIGSSLHITPEGDIYPCWGMIGRMDPLGNAATDFDGAVVGYLEGSLDGIYSMDAREKCKDCDVRYLCGGICFALDQSDCSEIRSSYLGLINRGSISSGS